MLSVCSKDSGQTQSTQARRKVVLKLYLEASTECFYVRPVKRSLESSECASHSTVKDNLERVDIAVADEEIFPAKNYTRRSFFFSGSSFQDLTFFPEISKDNLMESVKTIKPDKRTAHSKPKTVIKI